MSITGLEDQRRTMDVRLDDDRDIRRWVDEHHQDVFRFMRHLTRNQETAEDLTQQTFLKAWKSIHQFRGQSSMRVWLHAIAYREYAGWRRRHILLMPFEALMDVRSPRETSPEFMTVLEDALNKIPSVHKEAFVLHEVMGLSVEEISNVTGVVSGTVKSRLHHARRHLQKLLKKEDFGGER